MEDLFCVQGRKDVVVIFNNLLRRQIGTRSPTVEYICIKQDILLELIKGWVPVVSVLRGNKNGLSLCTLCFTCMPGESYKR